MKTEKFFEAFTELDDDLIENALPKDQDYDVVKPALKIHSWKPWVAGAAVAAAAFGVVFAGFKLFGGEKPGFTPAVETSGDSGAASDAVDNAKYGEMMVDWVVYGSAQELVDASDIICTAKVNDISFALIDPKTGKEIEDGDDPSNGELYTVYDIYLTKVYRSNVINKGRLWFRVMGGLKGYKTDEQLELLKRTGSDTIPVMHEPPEIELGEEYLFLLANFDYAPAGGSRLPTLINAPQGAFPLSDQYTDDFSGASALDIINCVEGNAPVENKIGLAITHNGNYISLTDMDKDELAAAVQDALANDCLPENQLKLAITEQLIKEYSGSGFVIDLTFNDVDAPLPGGGEDKKAKTICHVTVLIGENFSNAYLTYSFTSFDANGNSDQYNGGTYAPSAETLDAILNVIGARNHNDCEPEMLFDYFYLDNMQWNKTQDFTLPEFDGVTFRWSSDKITAVKNGTETELFSGMPVWSVYLADLNGDGKREICSTVSYGSGEIDDRIRAYDYANGYLYELEDRPTSDYSLKMQDGELMYVHSMHSSVSNLGTKPLTIGDMTCHSTTPGVHHGEETSHHDEPEHTAVTPTPTVTTGTHHSEHDETHH